MNSCAYKRQILTCTYTSLCARACTKHAHIYMHTHTHIYTATLYHQVQTVEIAGMVSFLQFIFLGIRLDGLVHWRWAVSVGHV